MRNHVAAKASPDGYIQMMDGIQRKTLVYGDNTLLAEFRLKKGKTLPLHRHGQEQTGYLVSGQLALTIAGHRYEMMPGDSWSIPGNVEHGAEILADSIVIEAFSPVREDFIPKG